MDFAEIGRQLKEQRLAMNLDLNDIQAATKIRKRYLQAIEAGDIDTLPDDVYTKGFLRAYANYVGLNGKEIIEQFNRWRSGHAGTGGTESTADFSSSTSAAAGRKAGTHRQPARRSVRRPSPAFGHALSRSTTSSLGGRNAPSWQRSLNRRASPGAKRGPWLLVFGLALLLVVLVYAFLQLPDLILPGGDPSVTQPDGIAADMPDDVPEPDSDETPPVEETEPEPEPPATPDVALREEGNTIFLTLSAPTAVEAIEVDVVVHEACWVRVVADGTVISEKTLQPGDREQWRATSTLEVRAGYPRGLELTVNGTPVERFSMRDPRWLQISIAG